ncbi:potassium transporter [Nakamurella aerolata]|uniref:Potassium transporter n=1 Tax=Nakamurella aerolata TaxID=1656892 RepID=A0A849ACP7_9ACTN|nr:potassium transporter [Nakamurella aerolata]NNG36938.1 potassium transporter [Nakamurella aerolata]
MPRLKRETFGSGDQTWLGSDHGLFNARTGTLDVSTFTAGTHYPNGYFPSGLIVNCADEGAIKPFTGGAGEQLGFVLTDQSTDGVADIAIPVLRHGLIKTAHLPVSTNLPATAPAGFVFIGGN